jgi:bacteriocin biosynthesis cyclodehydratase domain-containing protein
VAERLAEAIVGIVGSSPRGAEIARLLRLCGLDRIRRIRRTSRATVSIAIVAPGDDELAELRSWNRIALERGTPWLPVRAYDGRIAAVGPLMVPGESCCFECVLIRRAANVEYGEHLHEIEEAPLAVTADAALDAVVTAVAAHLVLRSVAGRDTTIPGVLYAVESRPALALGEHPVLRVPRCSACSGVEWAAPRLPWHEAEAA